MAKSTTNRAVAKQVTVAPVASGASAVPGVLPDAEEEGHARSRRHEQILFEIAWEVCNQVGGIYTVIRSKVPSMVDRWHSRYCLVGPYNHATASVEFEEAPLSGAIGQAVKQLRDLGIGAHYGRWLVTGRPTVVLLDYLTIFNRLHEIKFYLWKNHHITLPGNDELMNNVVAFGELVRLFLWAVSAKEAPRKQIVAHFHEWMAGSAIPDLRRESWPGAIVFTTHATVLGRYLAMNSPVFYDHLSFFDADKEAHHYNVQGQHGIEKAAAHGSHVFTTVSDITALECRHLLGRSPDVLLPNGLNISRFEKLHEMQNLHRIYKEKVHEFTMGHFFPSYTFDLDRTLYFFTSGRYEYRNKGLDLTIEALARLNYRLRHAPQKMTVVAFIITKRPFKSINVNALHSRAMLDEFQGIANEIKGEIGTRLFRGATEGKIPDLNNLVDEYWLLRLRRTIQAWKRGLPPGIVTHDLVDDQKDEVLNQLRSCRLWNQQDDPVKVIYHPDFVSSTNPLWGMEYDQFVRGCHLGVFPSYYEPWGYTPLESIASGVPAVTSDLAGFGAYLMQLLPEHDERGMYCVHRRYSSFDQSANELTDLMYRFCQLSQRERVALRNSVEGFAEHFDWHNLGKRYHEAHELAMDRAS
ncbi:MAG: glycosyltransferase [Phycisphaeraceae bacterium]